MRREGSANAARRDSSSGPAPRRESSASRPAAAVRTSSAQRRTAAVPPRLGDLGSGSRPTSRQADAAASPASSDAADSRSSGRPSPEARPGYPASGHSKPSSRAPAVPVASSARSASGSRAAPAPSHAEAVASSARSASGSRAAPAPAAVRSSSSSRPSAAAQDPSKAPISSYLRVYGLSQYARAFVDGGFSDLDSVSKLSETDALEFLERLRVYPGHRLKLLRAIDCLRHAAIGSERRDAAQMLEDDAALERLCAQKDQLKDEKETAEGEKKKLQEETSRLLGVMRQQDTQLQKARDRIAELEELVQSQTEQVNFLAEQLQNVAQDNPQKQEELYKSYRDSLDASDWGTGKKIDLPDVTTKPGSDAAAANIGGLLDMSKPGAFSAADFSPPLPKARIQAHADASPSPARPPPAIPTNPPPPDAFDAPPRATGFTAKAKMARSLDSAQIRECLAGFDVDNVIKCLAIAVQNKIILTVGKPRPHTNGASNLEACAIFLEPVCKDRLLQDHAASRPTSSGVGSELSFCSPLMPAGADGGGAGMLDTLGKPVHPLNSIVVRNAPNKWDIYGFCRDVMVNFRLQPEVSVITLFYLERFAELSGVAITPDNWQRLTITAMMLASKVWDDESFENIEFSQLCPLYTLDEINAFERIFLKCVGYNMACRGSQYAKTYFLLRTLGAKDTANFGLEPMDEMRATRLTERCLEKQIEFKDRYPDDLGSNQLNWTM